MAKSYKIILLIMLSGVSIILSAAILGLQLMYQKRQQVLKRTQAKKGKGRKGHDEHHTSSSLWNHTIKNSRAVDSYEELHIRRKAVPNQKSLTAKAHLSLALEGMPFYSSYTNAEPIDFMDAQSKDQKLDDNMSSSSIHETNYSSILDYTNNLIQSIFLNGEERTSEDSSNLLSDYHVRQRSLYHLEKAVEMGNPDAQNLMANILASGILPFHDNAFTRNGLSVQEDFAVGGEQLTKALILWHLSAMGGNIEAAMALGYRHYISATSGSDRQTLIDEHSLIPGRSLQSKNSKMMTHSTSGKQHYGVLGTCETTMRYYEAAANAVMDELESSPLRGKVSPAQDFHRLAEIHQKGSSFSVSIQNKPDELDEAITYYKMRAENPRNPDIHAAYKVANMYHYGLRGVKQDMKQALKYYEIAADANSWEAAGQAGKFHLWGMGLDSHERNLKKSYKYFQIGSPGGIEGCKRRFERKLALTSRKDSNMGVEDIIDTLLEGSISLCDHPSVNGMGLMHLFGVPMLAAVNLTLAVDYFELAKSMGNMDAYFNLAMMRLGWMNPYYDKAFSSHKNQRLFHSNEIRSVSKKDYIEASLLLKRAHEMGHIQAKHRLAMLYSSGVDVDGATVIKKDCSKATALYKEIALNLGTTTSRRMRSAYKQFISKDYESSLRNYLAVAETGSITAQVNAAFLLERGHCLGMNRLNCMKASVRLWRAAARQGDEEACLRVGDFYYYGRLREGESPGGIIDGITQRDLDFSTSPTPWVRYVIYPDDLISKLLTILISNLSWFYGRLYGDHSNQTLHRLQDAGFCEEHSKTCSNIYFHPISSVSEHFDTAVQYYRKAADDHESARAYFNLAFMHEWGLGVTQDFTLAKRYYDLASKNKGGEGEVAAQIALLFMLVHEYVLKAWYIFTKHYNRVVTNPSIKRVLRDEKISAKDIIVFHAFSFDSALIILLVWVLLLIIRNLKERRRR